MPRPLNNAEGGSNTTTVTTGNSGGSSGTAFDAVSIGASGTLIYDNSVAAHGSLSLKYTAVAAGVYAAWQSATLGTARQLWFYRCYINVAALPVSDTVIADFYGGGTKRCTMCMTSTGQIRWKDSTGATIQTSTSVLTATAWSRIEGLIGGHATAGQVETKLYTTMDSLTAAQTQSSAATQNTGGTIDEVRWGDTTGIAVTYNLDDLGMCDLGYLGPANLTYTDPVPNASLWGDTPTLVTPKTYGGIDLFSSSQLRQLRVPTGGGG